MPLPPLKDAKINIKQQSKGLDPSQRPLEVKQAIDIAFNAISSDISSQWGKYNGQESYGFAGIEDELLLEKMIFQRMKEGQTEFNIMEIGAGNFQWGRKLAKWLNNHPSFKDKIKVSIFSLRGERNLDKEVTGKNEDVCALYEYGNFKIENLHEELAKRGHTLTNQVDLIGSWWTFRHLVDPIGTLVEAYELLRVDTGIICVEGFEFDIANYRSRNILISLVDLFTSFNAPYFMLSDNGNNKLNAFLMQKSKTPCQIPLQYKGVIKIGENMAQIDSQHITSFYDNGMKLHELSSLVKRQFQGLTYYTNSFKSGKFYRSMLNNSDRSSREQKKIVADFKQLSKPFVNSELDKLCEQLRQLIKLDQKQALCCVNELLNLDNAYALVFLNHRVKYFGSILRIAYSNYVYIGASLAAGYWPKLFQKMVEISTADIVNLKDPDDGKTLLHCMAGRADIEDMKMLFSSSNVDVTATSKIGKTALDYAQDYLSENDKEYKENLEIYAEEGYFLESANEEVESFFAECREKIKNAETALVIVIIKTVSYKQQQSSEWRNSLPALANHLSNSAANGTLTRQLEIVVDAKGVEEEKPRTERSASTCTYGF